MPRLRRTRRTGTGANGRRGQIPDMGARVNHANHLGPTLTLPSASRPTPLASYQLAVDAINAWRSHVFRSRILIQNAVKARGLPEGQP
jgi:hypothetical protein